ALCLVLRESARVLARVPLLECAAAALAVQRYGTDALRAEVLPRVARGELVLTVAPNGRTGHDPAERAVQARRDGERWLLDGVQRAAPWAYGADGILVPARTGPADGGEGRTVLALVPREHPGATLDEQVSTNGERYAELRLDSVALGAD